MFFSWLLKKQSRDHEEAFELLLGLESDPFIERVSEMIVQQHEASNAMCLVALQNLEPMLSVAREYAGKYRDKSFPSTIEEHGQLISRTLDARELDEIAKRRHYWFLLALLIKRTVSLAKDSGEANPAYIRMWESLVSGGQYLHSSLEHNVVWSDLEKEWFSPLRSEKEGAKYALNFIVPKELRSHEKMRQLAELLDLHLVAGHYL